MHHPLTDIHAHFEINWLVRYQNTAKRNYFHRRTEKKTKKKQKTIQIGSFFEEKKTTKITPLGHAPPPNGHSGRF